MGRHTKAFFEAIARGVLALAIALPLAASAATASGQFLDIQPELAPDPDRPGASVWLKPGFDRIRYTKVMLEPLSVFLAPDSEYTGFRADEVDALGRGYRDALVQTLQPELPVVDVPGSGVLYVRAALTGVKLKKKERGLLSFTPIGMVVTAAQDAAGKRVSLESAVLEIEAYDAVSRERVAVIVDRRPTPEAGGELSWKSVEETFRFYATRFKSRMLAARKEGE